MRPPARPSPTRRVLRDGRAGRPRARRACEQAAGRRPARRLRRAAITPIARSRPAAPMVSAVDARFGDRCRIGVGINSGLVLVGTIGAAGVVEHGVIGDPVNVAARVQDATRELGEPLLLTEATLRAARWRSAPSSSPRGSLCASRQGASRRGLRARGGLRNGSRTPGPYNGAAMIALTRPFRHRLTARPRAAARPPRPSRRPPPAQAPPEQPPVDIAPNDPLLAYLQSGERRRRRRGARARLARAARAEGRRREAGGPARQPGRADRRAQPRPAPVRAGLLLRRPQAARQPRRPGGAGAAGGPARPRAGGRGGDPAAVRAGARGRAADPAELPAEGAARAARLADRRLLPARRARSAATSTT